MASDMLEALVTRERVVGPPPRFIAVKDGDLVKYFQGAFGATNAASITAMHQLMEGVCTHDFTAMRRRLEADFSYFADAAAVESNTPLKPAPELDTQELRFLSDFTNLMEASHYRMLSKAEWDAAMAEDFLFTLPCDVKWDAMDDTMLRRYWAAYPEERETVPAAIADRIMIFHRGVDVANMQGRYVNQKIDTIISFWLLQPLYRLLVLIATKLGIKKFVPPPPPGMAEAKDVSGAMQAATERAARARLHPASVTVDRHTFARAFPDGKSVMKSHIKIVKLQEACFRDLVILYRKAIPDKLAAPGEFDIINDADPEFLKRNIVIKQFRGIPMADLEMIMPEKKIFVPPQVLVQMAITLIGGIVAMVVALKSAREDEKLNMTAMGSAVSLLGTRGMQVYSSAQAQKSGIEKAMQNLLFERSVGSGEGVLANLLDEMCRQRIRELLVCYCMLLDSQRALTVGELDRACEDFLTTKFGCKIDFTCEEALPTLKQWGLAVTDVNGALTALPLPAALLSLDAVWDGLFDGKKGLIGAVADDLKANAELAAASARAMSAAAGATLGRALSRVKEPTPEHAGMALSAAPAPAQSPNSSKSKAFLGKVKKAFS